MKNTNVMMSTLMVFLVAMVSFAQEEVKYEDVKNALVTKGQFSSYISKDGSIYKMTSNHKLLVNRDEEQIWLRCDELLEGDDVVNILE